MKISYDYSILLQELLDDIENHNFGFHMNEKIMVLRQKREFYNPIIDYFNIIENPKEKKGFYYEILNIKDVLEEIKKMNSII